jgi:hypothetical protein
MARAWLIRCRDWIVGEAGELVVLGAVAAKLLCGDSAEPGHPAHARHAAHAARAGHAAPATHRDAHAQVAHAWVAHPAVAHAPRVATRPHAGRTAAAGTVAGMVAGTARVVANCPASQERARAADVRARARRERALPVVVMLRAAPAAGAELVPVRPRRAVPAPRHVIRVAAESAAVPALARHAT